MPQTARNAPRRQLERERPTRVHQEGLSRVPGVQRCRRRRRSGTARHARSTAPRSARAARLARLLLAGRPQGIQRRRTVYPPSPDAHRNALGCRRLRHRGSVDHRSLRTRGHRKRLLSERLWHRPRQQPSALQTGVLPGRVRAPSATPPARTGAGVGRLQHRPYRIGPGATEDQRQGPAAFCRRNATR